MNLSLNYQKGLIQIKDISKKEDIPIKYLEQIVLILKGAGYIRSRRGPSGGIQLAKAPEKIRLGEIIRLMDGTTAPITCVSKTEKSNCNDIHRCPFRDVFVEIRESINNIVDNTTFADMVEKIRRMSTKSPDYSI
ncbi:MAG: hypothetical protein A2539_10720 [Elusimicrobia bacterium RIFOXYD2_FULL_34_15]|nr:MAG: hypothetical protein A2539_10720 [Elusimicrobia bacterium RIFOXYD2_FULL_34_15]